MDINPKKHLVIIQGKERTDDVLRISQEANHTVITYKGNKSYRYARRNIQYFSNPQRIQIDNHRLLIADNMLSDVAEVLRFEDWVKIFHGTGGSRCCRLSELVMQRMTSSSGRSKDVLAYFRALAEGVSLKTDEGKSLLATKYRQLNIVPRNSVLSSFLQARSPVSESVSPGFISDLIFPFGCNMSQKKAVQRAFSHSVSLVRGPPGTGKTQTILNMIGNMLLQNKRVAVVSNNNSATANVFEKLQKYELDFVTASLGSAENKQTFIREQTGSTVRMPTLQSNRKHSVYREILRLNQQIDKALQ